MEAGVFENFTGKRATFSVASVGCSISPNIFTAFRCGSSNRSSIRLTGVSRDVGLAQGRDPFRRGLFRQMLFQVVAHILGVLGACLLRLETRIAIDEIGLPTIAENARQCLSV